MQVQKQETLLQSSDYGVSTKYGMLVFKIPFKCQCCGKCCYPFNSKCSHLTKDNLCDIYQNRPNFSLFNCRQFPLHYSCGYSWAIELKCPSIFDWIKLKNTLLIGYSCYCSPPLNSWKSKKIPEKLLLHLKDKLIKFNVSNEQIKLFMELNEVK